MMSAKPTILATLTATLLVATGVSLSQQQQAEQEQERDPGSFSVYEAAKGETLDAYIAGRLITAYALSEHLSPFDVKVQVEDGVVTLSGAVENEVLRDLAVEIANGVDEVKQVRSNLKVEPMPPSPAEPGGDRFVDRFDDATVTARVKTRLLWSRSTSGLAIDVDTNDHVVVLRGTVDTPAERALAEQIAMNTDGVQRVDNRLDVKDLDPAREQR